MKIHCIGIGGIGVSALAQYYMAKGHQVSGSDLTDSEITDYLKEKGVRIFIGNKAEHIKKGLDLVVYSPAVRHDNPELMMAKNYRIKAVTYPEALGELTRQYFTIAVSGAHGKSTTTAMIALILVKAGLDPTVIIGTKLKEFGDPALSSAEGTNFRMGSSEFLVIEACEYDASFTNYFPKIAVVTNIDKEHMDYFKTFRNVVKIFKQFIVRLPYNGFLIINEDDKYSARLKIKNPKFKIKQYSLHQSEAKKIAGLLKIPGKHNVSNALASLAAARILGIKDNVSFKALSVYKGSWRRFELFNKKLNKPHNPKAIRYTLISDYGHHPNEVRATLQAVREKYPSKEIWCIFQPHQYQRTYYLFKDFVNLFRKVPIDHVIITDIYDVAGRETKKINARVDSALLAKKINRINVVYMATKNAEAHVRKNIKNGQVLIIMGAGDIYKLVEKF